MAWKALLRLMAIDRVPFRGRKISDGRHVLDAGIVDQDIQATQFGPGPGDHRVDRRRIADIGAVIDDADAVLGRDLGAELLDGGRVAEAVQNDGGAFGSQGAGNAQTDPACRACDKRHFAVKVHPTRSLYTRECLGGTPPHGKAWAVRRLVARRLVE